MSVTNIATEYFGGQEVYNTAAPGGMGAINATHSIPSILMGPHLTGSRGFSGRINQTGLANTTTISATTGPSIAYFWIKWNKFDLNNGGVNNIIIATSSGIYAVVTPAGVVGLYGNNRQFLAAFTATAGVWYRSALVCWTPGGEVDGILSIGTSDLTLPMNAVGGTVGC